MEITREQLRERARGKVKKLEYAITQSAFTAIREGLEEELELARIALASLEAKPIGAFHISDQQVGGTKDYIKDGEWPIDDGVIEVYAAPPAPVSVPDGYRLQPISEYDAMCAAMLQGADTKPMQPLVIDAHGTLRFKENPIVGKLLDYAAEHGYGLNEIAREGFNAEDQMQLAQLIGYSLSGYGTLSYVTDESYERAAASAPQREV